MKGVLLLVMVLAIVCFGQDTTGYLRNNDIEISDLVSFSTLNFYI